MTACVVPYLVVYAIQKTWNHWEYSRLQGFHVVCKKSDIALEKPDFSPYTVQHCLIHINKNKQAWLQCSFSVKEIIMWFIKDSSTWHWQFERPSAMFHQRWRWAVNERAAYLYNSFKHVRQRQKRDGHVRWNGYKDALKKHGFGIQH